MFSRTNPLSSQRIKAEEEQKERDRDVKVEEMVSIVDKFEQKVVLPAKSVQQYTETNKETMRDGKELCKRLLQ